MYLGAPPPNPPPRPPCPPPPPSSYATDTSISIALSTVKLFDNPMGNLSDFTECPYLSFDNWSNHRPGIPTNIGIRVRRTLWCRHTVHSDDTRLGSGRTCRVQRDPPHPTHNSFRLQCIPSCIRRRRPCLPDGTNSWHRANTSISGQPDCIRLYCRIHQSLG